MTCFIVKIVAPAAPPQKRQHYIRLDHLGRWGPRSGRPGHRPPGEMRYFPNDLGSFPGREAGSVWETHNTIEDSTSLMAPGAVIYGISGDAVLRIRNTHGDLASRPAAGPVIYGIFGDAAFDVGDTHGDSTSWPAKTLMVSRNRSRVCRFCRVLSVRWGSGSSGSRTARRFCPAGMQNHGTSESQVAQFAGGTPILPHWTVKPRHHGGPEAPGGPSASHGTKNLRKAPPKCTPETGFGGKSLCRRSAGGGPPPRRPTPHRRIGLPHATWAPRVSSAPRIASPAGPKRRAAREPDDPDPQRTDKTRQNRHIRLRFLDIIRVFADRDVASP